MNTAARRMIVAASASSSQGPALEGECALEGFDRPIAAERSFDAAAEPVERENGVTAARIDGGIELIQRICRDMQARGEVSILLTGSNEGFMPARYHPAYAGARQGGSAFSWMLKDELQGTGITATCVVPDIDDDNWFGRADEPVARIAADVSYAWNKLQAAVATLSVWAASLVGAARA